MPVDHTHMKIVPLKWRFGESVLISKTEDLSDPSNFRNITKTNTSGELNMGILADKMLDYMVSNKYISIYKYKQVYRQGCSDQWLSEENSRLPRAARYFLSRWIWWMHTTESHTTWSSMPSSITSSLNGSSRREVPFEREKDWMLIWDEDTLPAQFPQHIYNTSQRPDIVVWSNSLREVVLIKLTCGDESKISDQVACKEARYNRELIPGIDGCGWKTWLFTVEIGGGF